MALQYRKERRLLTAKVLHYTRPKKANPNANLDTTHKWISNGASGVQLKRERSSQGLAGCMAQREDWETLDLIFSTFLFLFLFFTSISHQEKVAHDIAHSISSWVIMDAEFSLQSDSIHTIHIFCPFFVFFFFLSTETFAAETADSFWCYATIIDDDVVIIFKGCWDWVQLTSFECFKIQNIEIFLTYFFLLFKRHSTIECRKTFHLSTETPNKLLSSASEKIKNKKKKLEFKVSKKVLSFEKKYRNHCSSSSFCVFFIRN